MLRKLSTHIYSKILYNHLAGSLYKTNKTVSLVQDRPKVVSEQEHMLLWYMYEQKPYCLTESEERELR